MKKLRHRLIMHLAFPEGISPGEESRANRMLLACDGLGRYVLRGTALAGALRHQWARQNRVPTDDDIVNRWFGHACDADCGNPSPLRVPDCILKTGNVHQQLRTHNAIDRHTGAALQGGLFEIETLPPGTTCDVLLELDSDRDDAKHFLQSLTGAIQNGLTLGGRSARGIGRSVLRDTPLYKRFDLSDSQQLAAWLDESYTARSGNLPVTGTPLTGTETAGTTLSVSLTLGVPRGQDVLPGDGQGLDCDLEPRRVATVENKENFCIPGSALRGVFRSWMSRLAARDGEPVADSVKQRQERLRNGDPLTGDDLAWGGIKDLESRDRHLEDPDLVKCPIMRLFGSAYSAGRIHIADAFAHSGASSQGRRHVAIDRFSGGANEGMLFDNSLLTKAEFTVKITINSCSEKEASWFARTIRAIDMGIVRLGSSKSAGRLALKDSPTAHGKHADIISQIQPREA